MKKKLICLFLILVPFMSKAQNEFLDYIKVDRNILFEEKEGGILNTNASWVYNTGVDSRILDTNLTGHNVSLYDSSGKFINRFGSRGRGPGDFEFPMSTIELNDGTLLVSEYSGKLSQFTNNGDSLINIRNTEITPLSNIIEIDDDRILLIGNRIKANSQLHIYNKSRDEIEKSFLELPFGHADFAQVLRMNVQLTVASVHNNKIYAALIPFQKIYVFSLEGVLEETFEIELNNFITIEKNNKSLTTEGIFSYMTTFSQIERFFHLKNGSFLIQYSKILEIDYTNPSDRITQYNLAYFSNERELVFEIEDGPELLGINKLKSNLYFRGYDRDPTYLIQGRINN